MVGGASRPCKFGVCLCCCTTLGCFGPTKTLRMFVTAFDLREWTLFTSHQTSDLVTLLPLPHLCASPAARSLFSHFLSLPDTSREPNLVLTSSCWPHDGLQPGSPCDARTRLDLGQYEARLHSPRHHRQYVHLRAATFQSTASSLRQPIA